MDLQRKLSRLSAARSAKAPPEPPPEPAAAPPDEAVFEALRAQLQRRKGRLARASVGADVALFHDEAPWPFTATESEHGTLHRRIEFRNKGDVGGIWHCHLQSAGMAGGR